MKAPVHPGAAILTLIPLLFIVSVRCDAQPSRVPRVSFLSGLSDAVLSARVKAFRTGLNDLGYVEGKNIIIEYHWGGAKLDRITELAADAVRLKPDVIVTSGPPATRAARAATKTIPIVMAFDTDPVGNDFVANLSRPGGNITGLSALFREISGKRLELLRTCFHRHRAYRSWETRRSQPTLNR